MAATEGNDSRGKEPYIFPGEKPTTRDVGGDNKVYVLLMNDDGSPKVWKFKGAKELKHNTIWAPGDHASRLRRTKMTYGDHNGAPPLPLPIKILALRGE